MQTVPLQLSDVIYNAATQSFEALVTVHDRGSVRSYACAIDAPIEMEFDVAARGLATQAIRRHRRGRADAVHMPAAAIPQRARQTVAGLRRYSINPGATLRTRAA